MDTNKISTVFQGSSVKPRLDSKLESLLNDQIAREFEASQVYLALATWCEFTGYEGTSQYLLKHVDEERTHMLKLRSYLLDKNLMPKTPAVKETTCVCKDLKDVLKTILDHEIKVTESYEQALLLAKSNKDEMTYEFLQWFIHEQLEEESIYLNLLDRLEIIGYDQRGMYFLDNEIKNL